MTNSIILFSHLLLKFLLFLSLNLVKVLHYHFHILNFLKQILNLLSFLYDLSSYLLQRNALLIQPKYLMNYQKQFNLNYVHLISILKKGQKQTKKLQLIIRINMKPMKNSENVLLNFLKIGLNFREKYQGNKLQQLMQQQKNDHLDFQILCYK